MLQKVIRKITATFYLIFPKILPLLEHNARPSALNSSDSNSKHSGLQTVLLPLGSFNLDYSIYYFLCKNRKNEIMILQFKISAKCTPSTIDFCINFLIFSSCKIFSKAKKNYRLFGLGVGSEVTNLFFLDLFCHSTFFCKEVCV